MAWCWLAAVHTWLPVWQDGSVKTEHAPVCVFAVGNGLIKCQGSVLEQFCPLDSGWFEITRRAPIPKLSEHRPVGAQALSLGQKVIP